MRVARVAGSWWSHVARSSDFRSPLREGVQSSLKAGPDTPCQICGCRETKKVLDLKSEALAPTRAVEVRLARHREQRFRVLARDRSAWRQSPPGCEPNATEAPD